MTIYNFVAYALKPVLESSRSYDDQLNVANKSHVSTGSQEPTQGSLVCSVQQRGPHHSSHGLPRAAYTQRGPQQANQGVPAWSLRASGLTHQSTEYPRAAYTQRGLHQSNQGVPAWSLHATGLTEVVRNYPRVSALRGPRKSKHGLPTWNASYGVYTSLSTDFSRKRRIHWPNN